MYSPTLGRWVQQDPTGYVDGTSLYQYIGTGPLGAVDPYGTYTIVSVKYPDGGTMTTKYGLKDWLHPQDEGKPCECDNQWQFNNFNLWGKVGIVNAIFWFQLNTYVSFDTKGPVKDISIAWWTCVRPDNTTEIMPAFMDQSHMSFWAGGTLKYGGNYLTKVFVRFLACEDGFWKSYVAKAQATWSFTQWSGYYLHSDAGWQKTIAPASNWSEPFPW